MVVYAGLLLARYYMQRRVRCAIPSSSNTHYMSSFVGEGLTESRGPRALFRDVGWRET